MFVFEGGCVPAHFQTAPRSASVPFIERLSVGFFESCGDPSTEAGYIKCIEVRSFEVDGVTVSIAPSLQH